MSKNLFVGVDGKARKAKELYVGVDGKARKIAKAYIGDENGKARLFWEKESTPITDSLEFVSNNSFTISATKLWDGTLEYNNGNGNGWTTWDGSEISSNAIDGRQRIYFRGSRNTVIRGQNATEKNSWEITGSNVECNGNIECLLDYQKVAAGEHPEMGSYCYREMFSNCSSLITSPELPAITLVYACYQGMFRKCSSLTTVSALPATTLAVNCYNSMFNGCSSLRTAPILSATTLADQCCYMMFRNCSSLRTAPELPATTLAKNCYASMFNGCSSLTQAPVLPATTLAESCYASMFYNCYLTTTPQLPATTLANSCYSNMFSNCGRLTTATALPATTLAPNCYANMFTYCQKLTTVPALPAITLAMSCYVQMFFGSISISETQSEDYPTPYRIPITGEGTVGSNSLGNMFNITPTINTTYYLPKGISIIS